MFYNILHQHFIIELKLYNYFLHSLGHDPLESDLFFSGFSTCSILWSLGMSFLPKQKWFFLQVKGNVKSLIQSYRIFFVKTLLASDFNSSRLSSSSQSFLNSRFWKHQSLLLIVEYFSCLFYEKNTSNSSLDDMMLDLYRIFKHLIFDRLFLLSLWLKTDILGHNVPLALHKIFMANRSLLSLI